jgi:hypothetical protein
VQPHSRDRSPGRPSLGVRFSFRAELLLGCPRSGIVAPTYVDAASSRARESPLLGFLLPSSTLTPGAPCRTHRRQHRQRRLPAAGRVRVTRPSPVPSSGFLPLSTVLAALAARTRPLRDPPFAVVPRRFAVLFHTARAHWSRPTELSLPEKPYPLSRAVSPLWVRTDNPTARHDPRVSRPLSPVAPTSRRGSPEGSPDCKAGTKVPWSR